MSGKQFVCLILALVLCGVLIAWSSGKSTEVNSDNVYLLIHSFESPVPVDNVVNDYKLFKYCVATIFDCNPLFEQLKKFAGAFEEEYEYSYIHVTLEQNEDDRYNVYVSKRTFAGNDTTHGGGSEELFTLEHIDPVTAKLMEMSSFLSSKIASEDFFAARILSDIVSFVSIPATSTVSLLVSLQVFIRFIYNVLSTIFYYVDGVIDYLY